MGPVAADTSAASGPSDWLVYLALPLFTFMMGIVISRLTMSKKERTDVQFARLDRSNTLSTGQRTTFEAFTKALAEYNSRPGDPTPLDFYQVATTGESYLAQVRMICDAILAGTVDETAVENSHLPTVKDVVERVLPEFFDCVQNIARRNSIAYSGRLRRADYESIYVVYEKYVGPIHRGP